MKKRFWLLTLLLVVLLVAAQCGGAPATTDNPAATEAPTATDAPMATEEAVATEEVAAQPEVDKELYVYNWADYIDEELLTMYEWPRCKLVPPATMSSSPRITWWLR
ncbi:MAG: hypothetical protein P8186_18055 [Anaerolineae bacterium]